MKKDITFLEKSKERIRKLKLFFSIISILLMLSYPLLQIYLGKGNKNINICVFIITFIYGLFWLILGSNKKYKINRIYKYSKLFLNLVSILINAYAIYITATNFNLISVIVNSFMTFFFILNLIYNILYDIISKKISILIKETKEDLKNISNKVRHKKLT